MEYRTEKDTMGEVKVPIDKYWGAQTQRSKDNFKIGTELMPQEIIKSFAILKKASAITNFNLGEISEQKKNAILYACDKILTGKLYDNFPLVVWQTGSGTQTNMNVNEVISGVANEYLKDKIVHPNDDVNRCQSSNDTFPTAMHISAVMEIEDKLIPAINGLISTFKRLEKKYKGTFKSGRTHLQDAVPIDFAQEISGWREMIEKSKYQIKLSLSPLRELALGGTAVGTGLNTNKDFAKEVAKEISTLTGKKFVSAKNKFYALTSKDALVFSHGALKGLSANLMKIANDIRWLSSGPRNGLGEIFIPENEPGSSIMPGKVNPTQCEAVTMVSVEVMANDVAVSIGASQGNFELNVFMPVIIYNFLQSVRLLTDVINSFNKNCVCGIKPNKQKMKENLNNSLMLVTALNNYIGYENSAKIAKKAYKENISLKQSAVLLGFLTEKEFDNLVKPEKMAYPNNEK